MVRWAAFAGLTVLSVSLFLALARASQTMVNDGTSGKAAGASVEGHAIGTNDTDDALAPDSTVDTGTATRSRPDAGLKESAASPTDREGQRAPTLKPVTIDSGVVIDGEHDGKRQRSTPDSLESMSTSALLLNVVFSQGLFGGLVLLGAWYTEIPLAALGVPGVPQVGTLVLGAGLGIALHAGNELMAAGASALGFSPPEDLRAMLAPDSVASWALLLGGILPAIAFVEELLFRAALIGALSAGFAVSPWLLAILSSIAFAVGHGAQGSLGMLVTGSLGLALAAAFVLTGSLFVVVLAHYLVNALEFIVHEGLGVDWSE
ncbi:CPBP family intramembrane metalloprotease [Halobacteriales archaeon QS_3_64_16]|nr:MAG: CPBP family intramembrane metalloprotease [Halobacteriales archaeon QS_3_64_16]